MTRRRAQAGFTLVELMVALVAGVIAITTIYFVGAASSRHFHEQQRISQTQMSLRMAMEQIRRDVQRAGFLGVPNSHTAQTCFTSADADLAVQAVSFQPNPDPGVLPNAGENNVVADRLVLTGNYATSDAYLVAGLTDGMTVQLQSTWQSFRRDFGGALPGQEMMGVQFDPNRFNAVFLPGRLLHLTNQLGNHFFLQITGTDPTQGRIRFQPGLTLGTPCVGGLADGGIVAPLSRIEYVVEDLTADGRGRELLPANQQQAGAQDARGLANAQLIRRELSNVMNRTSMTDVQGNVFERVLLEYVANVSYRFVIDMAPPGQPPQLVVGGAENPQVVQRLGPVQGNMAAMPQQVRSVIVTLSARTPEQDPRFAWVPGAAGNPAQGIAPTRYRVNPALPGAARVRTLTSEIFLPNVAP
jgi:prepilin-type N-terminal cleavage/methylation domain-containing protein